MATKDIPKIEMVIEGTKAIVKTRDVITGAIIERTLYTKDLFDGVAQLVENTKERSGPIYKTYGSDYAAVRYWEETRSGYLIMICEASPSIRTFNMNNIHRDDVGSRFPFKITNHMLSTKIHWPYTVMITVFQKSGGVWKTRDGYIGWSDTAINDINNHKVYGFALPNTYGSRHGDSTKAPYKICWGGVRAFSTCTEIECAQLLPLFYGSDFNLDLVDGSWLTSVLPKISYDSATSKDASLVNGRITEAYLAGLGGDLYLTRGTLAEGLKYIKGDR